jgi:ABC-type lipoprotein release transport system permease subunit
MIGKLALRNLTRNRWRTALTIAGVAVGVAILIWMTGYLMGFHDEIVRAATATELGQIQITKKEFVETPSARHYFAPGEGLQETVENDPQVAAASPRVSVYGLVGNEERSVVSRLVGVEPEKEKTTTVVATGITEGRWLSATPPEYPAPREAVLGVDVARQLKLGVGDEFVTFFEAADGSLGNELLKVVGIVKSGSTQIDRQTTFMHLEDLQTAAAMEGNIHQIAIKLDNPNAANEVADRLEQEIGRDDLAVRSWEEIVPEIKSMVELMKNSDLIMYVFVYILVAFGLFNAQRMSALERRREFAMMMAIGVTPRQLFWTVMLETVFIAIAGAMAGAIVGSGVTWYFVVNGLDLAALSSGDVNIEFMGISFSNRLYFSFGPGHVFRPMAVLVPFAVLCGLWPAIQAARVEITTALSGRN